MYLLCTNIERLRALLFLPRFLGLASHAAEGESSRLCRAQQRCVISPYALFSFYGSSGAFLRQRPVYPLFAGVSRCYSDTGFSHFVCFNLLQVAQSNEIASYMSIKKWSRCSSQNGRLAQVRQYRASGRKGQPQVQIGAISASQRGDKKRSRTRSDGTGFAGFGDPVTQVRRLFEA